MSTALRDRLDLAEVLDRAAVGIAQLDLSGQHLAVNHSYCELMGRTREQLTGATLQDSVHSEDLPGTLDALIRVVETGSPVTFTYRQLRQNGSFVWVSSSVSAARDARGEIEYLLAISHDVTAGKEIERAFDRTKADLRLLLDTVADGFYCIDRDGKIALCNATFLRLLGFAREEDAIGKDVHELIHHSRPDGTPYPKSDSPILRAAQYGIDAHVADEVFFALDGRRFPVEYWARPIVRDGEITGAVCTFIDITERRNSERHKELMNQELSHRVKNTLAVVQAIVGETLRRATDRKEATKLINARLFALSRAHNVLTRSRWGNAAIADVVEGVVSMHRSDPTRIRANGPRVDLGAKSALAITMALHELSTNAAKYGALSNSVGTVSIEWAITGGAADARLKMSWTERDGPPVTPPTHKGFGSRVIAESFGPEMAADVRLTFEPSGVRWTLEALVTAMSK